MLRAAAEAGTAVGLHAKEIMARGELVPDDLVVAIVASRIEEADARNGFVLDGFPRTIAQAHALDRMLKEKGLKLDAVIELKVDEARLLDRIEKRIAQTRARGQSLRTDDDPAVLRRRILAYRDQTAPLAAYYQLQSVLRSVDGMASVSEVAHAIDKLLAAAGKPGPVRQRRPAGERRSAGEGSRALPRGREGSGQSGLSSSKVASAGKSVSKASKAKRAKPKSSLKTPGKPARKGAGRTAKAPNASRVKRKARGRLTKRN
jgi:adenylate kinase